MSKKQHRKKINLLKKKLKSRRNEIFMRFLSIKIMLLEFFPKIILSINYFLQRRIMKMKFSK
jgi:hypothetical protein